MKKNQSKWGLIITVVYFAYFLSGFVYNVYTENGYVKKAEEKADINRNSKLEVEEVLAVYQSFGYSGEKILSVIRSYNEQIILSIKLAQMESNKRYVAELTVDSVQSFNSRDLVRTLVDTDRNGELSFEEGAVAFTKLHESYPNRSCPLRLVSQRPISSRIELPFQLFFNPWNLSYGSELQRYATGQ